MTVRELINRLLDTDPNMEVHLSYNYGDHWATIVAPRVKNIEIGHIEYSDYHNMPKLCDYSHQEGEEVVVLNS